MGVAASNQFYNRFYRDGGWVYHTDEERRTLATVAALAGWRPGDRVVEVGAGMGHHAEWLRQAGYQVTAVEASPVGAKAAAEQYPQLPVVCADAAAWAPDRPGHVYARGMSWWHYELDGVNRKGVDVVAQTRRLMQEWVAPGATMVLQIVTDLSGRRPDHGVHQNTVADYVGLFAAHGQVAVYDWKGRRLPGHKPHKGVIVVTRRAVE